MASLKIIIYYCREDRFTARALSGSLKLFGIKVDLQAMSQSFNLPDEAERMLILWSTDCSASDVGNWLRKFDEEMLQGKVSRRDLRLLNLTSDDHPFCRYLIRNGAGLCRLDRAILDGLCPSSVSFEPTAAQPADRLCDFIANAIDHGEFDRRGLHAKFGRICPGLE